MNKVDISIVGTNGKYFLINAHGVLRRMGAVTEIPGSGCIYQRRPSDMCAMNNSILYVVIRGTTQVLTGWGGPTIMYLVSGEFDGGTHPDPLCRVC